MKPLPRPWVSPRGLLLAALACAGLFSTEACQRKPRFIPLKGDSTSTAIVDSGAVYIREAQGLWENSDSADEAAALSARLLAERLGQWPTSKWKSRAGALLDSLGIGAESAEGACALAVNFFSRADPTAGSWPYLFWCAEGGALYQEIDGRGFHLLRLVTRGLGGRATGLGPGVAAVFASRAGDGQQPLVMAWSGSPETGRWRLIQTLGADSLGGLGSAEFQTATDASVDLVARTYRSPPDFDECPTCPHVFRIRRFHWGADGFDRVEDNFVPSPYATFVQFIQALSSEDAAAAAALVTDPSLVEAAQKLAWGRPPGRWRIAPVTEEARNQIVFYRGANEAYRVQFEQRDGHWLIAGFESVQRAVE